MEKSNAKRMKENLCHNESAARFEFWGAVLLRFDCFALRLWKKKKKRRETFPLFISGRQPEKRHQPIRSISLTLISCGFHLLGDVDWADLNRTEERDQDSFFSLLI